MDTGANDVRGVSDEQSAEQGGREHLVPWPPGPAVLEVDLEQGRILVDWDEDF
jgi:16S rRNA processing protein RimM